ncbi:hypothetical protein [Mycolicibacterium aubagnense]|jgi:hypothetical protein|uniref:Uncharacterized protein n=2 Tax=Mycolicibacterium aubagnense TaxID=319707 RepID=A0ABM7IMN6_9MYCO|nr:hypothetical protein [Mycolicibacterium aubagnense]TLH48600.1 hypothetical protein C1S80_29725 [Mycolicibacterium aubagnense]BBX88074.1 hypothetical protein MAUB_62750 [Mycolicibacterium aubagnense]
MGSNFAPNPGAAIDTAALPLWRATGHKHFPFAAHEDRCWWVLRLNFGFPKHDMYTLFVDGRAAADITASPHDRMPLVASIGALHWPSADPAIPMLDEAAAAAVVSTVAGYADYGSEHGDPCIFCSSNG